MNRKSRVLFCGPVSGEMCGQLAANLVVLDYLREVGATVEEIDTRVESSNAAAGVFSISKVLIGLKSYMPFIAKLFKVDVVYVTPGLSPAGLVRFSIYILAARLMGTKVVAHYHGGSFASSCRRISPLLRRIVKVLYGRVSTNIFITPSLLESASRAVNLKNCVVVENFVDDSFDVDLVPPKPPQVKRNCLFLSSLIPEKGWQVAVECVRLMRSRGFEVDLTLAGPANSSERVILEEMLSRYDWLNYSGVVSGNEKRDLFLSSDFFLFPSSYADEGVPLVLYEAMRTSNVLISTGIGGISELIVNDQNGCIAPVATGSVFASILENVLNGCDEGRLRARAFSDSARFSQAAFAQKVTAHLFGNEFGD